jgi:hypothetical protein
VYKNNYRRLNRIFGGLTAVKQMFDRLLDLHGETLTEKAKAIGPVGPNGGQNMLENEWELRPFCLLKCMISVDNPVDKSFSDCTKLAFWCSFSKLIISNF